MKKGDKIRVREGKEIVKATITGFGPFGYIEITTQNGTRMSVQPNHIKAKG